MKYIVIATALAILAGCAELQQSAAQGGTSASYNNPYPYNSPYGM